MIAIFIWVASQVPEYSFGNTVLLNTLPVNFEDLRETSVSADGKILVARHSPLGLMAIDILVPPKMTSMRKKFAVGFDGVQWIAGLASRVTAAVHAAESRGRGTARLVRSGFRVSGDFEGDVLVEFIPYQMAINKGQRNPEHAFARVDVHANSLRQATWIGSLPKRKGNSKTGESYNGEAVSAIDRNRLLVAHFGNRVVSFFILFGRTRSKLLMDAKPLRYFIGYDAKRRKPYLAQCDSEAVSIREINADNTIGTPRTLPLAAEDQNVKKALPFGDQIALEVWDHPETYAQGHRVVFYDVTSKKRLGAIPGVFLCGASPYGEKLILDGPDFPARIVAGGIRFHRPKAAP